MAKKLLVISILALRVRPGVAFLLLVVMPGAPSSVLVLAGRGQKRTVLSR